MMDVIGMYVDIVEALAEKTGWGRKQILEVFNEAFVKSLSPDELRAVIEFKKNWKKQLEEGK